MRIAVLVVVSMCLVMESSLQAQCPPKAICQSVQPCPPPHSVSCPNTCQSLGTVSYAPVYSAPVHSALPVYSALPVSSCGCNHLHGSHVTLQHMPLHAVQPSQTHYGTVVVGSESIVYSPALPTQNLASSNCNCGTVIQSSPQVVGQVPSQTVVEATTVANSAGATSPFSLSGYVRPEPQAPIAAPCLMQFLRCCKYGGRSCAYDYYLCSQATGEPMKHRCCPGEEPPLPPLPDE